MSVDDLDPGFLAWSMHRELDTARMPAGRTVHRVRIHRRAARLPALLAGQRRRRVDMCLKDPGYEVDVQVRSDLRLFIEAWRGIRDLRREIQTGRIELLGSPGIARAVSGLAAVEWPCSLSAAASGSRAAVDWQLQSVLTPTRSRSNFRKGAKTPRSEFGNSKSGTQISLSSFAFLRLCGFARYFCSFLTA